MLFISKKNIAVLLFHRILPVRDEMWDPIDPLLFDQTLQYVNKKFFVRPLQELLFEKKICSTKPLAAITFDDGYKDFIEYALPILDKYNNKASMYIISGCIDKNLPTWTYTIDYLFSKTQKLDWKNFDFPELPVEFLTTYWKNANERIEYGKKIKQYLKKIPAAKKEKIIESMLLNFDDIKRPNGLMMSWDEIKQLHNSGIEIGSHSVTHPTLATIEDENLIEFELKASASTIKEMTGITPDIFSYPIGSYDERVKRLVKKAGYKGALAVNQKIYNPVTMDLFEIPRIEFYNESWIKTKARANGMISYINKLKS